MKKFSDKVVYQIYPKSFMDSNGDGFGDIKGITQKLDYLSYLGVDYIWSTPFFLSPQRDNGYDVANYLEVDPSFGSMEDLEELISKASEKEIGIMFDMVFNHTSTDHKWFQEALLGNEKYMDYYIFKDGKNGMPPTNWQSKFGGSAWEYVPSLDKWYLHLFDRTQADLNWDNQNVRDELVKVVKFWKDKGVRGFRFDVINLISKPEKFLDDDSGDGRRFYTDGPNVHGYIKELVSKSGIDDMITVGEMSSTDLNNCIKYSNPMEKELSMVFNFHHLKVDYKNGNKWELMDPDLNKLKELFEHWQVGLQNNNGWSAVFWCNHDQPRIVSRLGDDRRYWKESAKMLGTMIHTMRGTPYIFQGEEIGMTNGNFMDITDYRDVESINYFKILCESGKSTEESLHILLNRSRDNSRTPVQWSNKSNAGFTSGIPWIEVNQNHKKINVESQINDPDSILNHYKKLIELRKTMEVLSDGTIDFIDVNNPNIIAFERIHDDCKILVVCNLKDTHGEFNYEDITGKSSLLISNYKDIGIDDKKIQLRPFESFVILI